MANPDYKAAIEALSAEFRLPPPRSHSQDWASEVPEAFRTAPHLAAYAASLVDDRWSDDVRVLLMSLALDVANDLSSAEGLALQVWGRIDAELRLRSIYGELIEKYCVDGTPLEDAYAITALVRTTARELGQAG